MKFRNVSTAIFASMVAVVLTVAGCTASPPSTDMPDTLRVGIAPDALAGSYDPTTLPSYLASAQAVYEPLFELDSGAERGGYVGRLATGYERSADWRTLTITLRDDVDFQDGSKLTADAVRTYLEGMAAVDEWWFKANWDGAQPTLTVTDETTLVVETPQPMSINERSFANALFTAVVIASPNALTDLAGTANNPAGTGPYILESSTPEVGATYTRNPDYYNDEEFPFENLELMVFADQIAAFNALKSGQIDVTAIPNTLAEEASSQGFLVDRPAINAGNMMLYVADRDGVVNPAFADKRVRQAMAYAFDRKTINETINLGYGDVKDQPFVETQPEYVEGGDDRYDYDPDKARDLMAEAGYGDGFDLVLPSTAFFNISSWEPIVQQYLGDIGIRVTFDTMDVGPFFDAVVNTTKYPVLMYFENSYQTIPVFITADAIFNTSFKITDPVVDDLWNDVQTGPDAAAEEAASSLGEYVLEESLLITLATPSVLTAFAPGFKTTSQSGGALLVDIRYEN
jgi:peptide/nickel transport system substrate-binding protein